jgi:hypothetical protein
MFFKHFYILQTHLKRKPSDLVTSGPETDIEALITPLVKENSKQKASKQVEEDAEESTADITARLNKENASVEELITLSNVDDIEGGDVGEGGDGAGAHPQRSSAVFEPAQGTSGVSNLKKRNRSKTKVHTHFWWSYLSLICHVFLQKIQLDASDSEDEEKSEEEDEDWNTPKSRKKARYYNIPKVTAATVSTPGTQHLPPLTKKSKQLFKSPQNLAPQRTLEAQEENQEDVEDEIQDEISPSTRGRRKQAMSLSEAKKKLVDAPEHVTLIVNVVQAMLADHQKSISTNFSRFDLTLYFFKLFTSF